MNTKLKKELEDLKRLQEVDLKIFDLTSFKENSLKEIKELENKLDDLESAKEKIKNEISDLIKNKTSCFDELALKKELLNSYKEQLDSSKSSREYESVSRALELSELDVQLLNKKGKNISTLLDSGDSKLKDIENEISALKLSINDKNSENSINGHDDEAIIKLKKKRSELAQSIPKNIIFSYDRVRAFSKSGLGAVNVERNACGSCFMIIPAQKQLNISACDEIHRCDYCGAIFIEVNASW